MRTLMRDENGSILILSVFLIPILIGIVGIVIDGGYLFYQKTLLEEATETAGKSTIIMSYDKDIWATQKKVVLLEDKARDNALMILKRNCEKAEIKSFEIISGNKVDIVTTLEVDFFFMKVFGFEKRELKCHQSYSGG